MSKDDILKFLKEIINKNRGLGIKDDIYRIINIE